MERKWLAIGQIAKRSGVKASALRFYEQKGLIQSLRSEGGRRLYPQDVLRRIAFIRVAQGMGLSLGEIGEALAGLPEGRTPDRRDWRQWLQATGLSDRVPLKGGQLFDMLELGIVAAARGYGVSIGDLLLVAEDVNAGRLGLPRPTAVYSGCSYYLVWPKTHRAQARLRRLRDFLLAEVAQMRLPAVERVMPGA